MIFGRNVYGAPGKLILYVGLSGIRFDDDFERNNKSNQKLLFEP